MRFRILPLLFLLHCWILGLGQTEKGSWIMNGNAAIEHRNEFNVSYSYTTLQSKTGYFFAHNLAAGSDINFSLDKRKDAETLKLTTYSATPFLRLYLFKGKFKPYLQTDFTFNWEKIPRYFNINIPGGPSIRYRTEFQTAASASLGVNYFLNQNVALNAQLYYYFKDGRESATQQPNTKFTSIEFGLTYFLNKNNDVIRSDSINLKDRFLKKGNFQYGLNSSLDFKNSRNIMLFAEVFLTDYLKLKNGFEGYLFRNVDLFEHYFYFGYQPEFQGFIPISSSTFFTPTVGGDFGLYHVNSLFNNRPEVFGWSLLGRPTLTHFRASAIFELGVEFRYFFRDRNHEQSSRWDRDVFFKITQFITPNLGVTLETRMTILGLSKRSVFLETVVDYPEFVRFGLQYFIEKKL